MIYQHNNYRQYLKQVLQERMNANSAYSMRSMARSFGLSPSTLCDVIHAKKNFSPKSAQKVAEALKLNKRQLRYFLLLAQYETCRNDEIKCILSESLRVLNPLSHEYFEIPVDQFKLISNWYHYAILEMTYLDDYKMTEENMAKDLNISLSQIKKAVLLLLKLDLIQKISTNSYTKTKKKFLTASQFPNQALRKFHKSMLSKAIISLSKQTPQEKIIGSETLPFDSADLTKANAVIEDCFEKLIIISEQSIIKTDVYHLGIQFFNLTKRKR